MTTDDAIKTLITPDQLNGDWEYSCEMLVPGSCFPGETLHNNESLIANRHGGTVNFAMFNDKNIQVNGKRMWRDIKNSDNYEELRDPIAWSGIFGIVFHDNQLLYQYKINNVEGINGITNVTLLENKDGRHRMEGWFYYVPDRALLDYLEELNIDMSMLVTKKFGIEWLKLFGSVKLTKI